MSYKCLVPDLEKLLKQFERKRTILEEKMRNDPLLQICKIDDQAAILIDRHGGLDPRVKAFIDANREKRKTLRKQCKTWRNNYFKWHNQVVDLDYKIPRLHSLIDKAERVGFLP